MDTLPPGERQDVITYRVIDHAGAIRISGVTEEKARATMTRLMESSPEHAPFTLERTRYVSFTHREAIEQAAVA